MRKLCNTDYPWLITKAQSINPNITIINLTSDACTGDVIDIFNVHNILQRKLRKIFARKSKKNALPWELKSILHVSEEDSVSMLCMIGPENTDTIVNSILKPAMAALQENPEVCGIQFSFRKNGNKEWENFLFYIA